MTEASRSVSGEALSLPAHEIFAIQPYHNASRRQARSEGGRAAR